MGQPVFRATTDPQPATSNYAYSKGEWGDCGEWGDEEVAEQEDKRTNEEFKRQWDKYWAKKENWSCLILPPNPYPYIYPCLHRDWSCRIQNPGHLLVASTVFALVELRASRDVQYGTQVKFMVPRSPLLVPIATKVLPRFSSRQAFCSWRACANS